MTFDLVAHRDTRINYKMVFDLPDVYRDVWQELCRKGGKHGDWFQLRVETVARKRSTGPGSQNHHINSHIAQIARETGNDFDAVKMYLKTEAISEGWGFATLPGGEVIPKSEREATVEEASALIETIHRFAAEWNIRLREE